MLGVSKVDAATVNGKLKASFLGISCHVVCLLQVLRSASSICGDMPVTVTSSCFLTVPSASSTAVAGTSNEVRDFANSSTITRRRTQEEGG